MAAQAAQPPLAGRDLTGTDLFNVSLILQANYSGNGVEWTGACGYLAQATLRPIAIASLFYTI